MKFRKISMLICLTVCFSSLQAQWSNKSFTFDSKVRQYRVYLPVCYNVANPASLVIALHGLGDNMTNFSNIGMNYIADTANFIFIAPQAWNDPYFGTAWNSGAGIAPFYPNASINDVGFLNALVDTALAKYSINPKRIYLCGFSMGGFMVQRMAVQSNGKFAAFASVAGTIGSGLTQTNPNRAIPVMHCHGTNDSTVYYNGNLFGIDPDSLVHFWVLNNQCNPTPVHTTLPDIVNDGDTVEHFLYTNGLMNSVVEFYKVRGAGHEWLFKPYNDISYSEEIWKFFRKYENNVYHVEKNRDVLKNIWIYPNPVTDYVYIQAPENIGGEKILYKIYSVTGAEIMSGGFEGSYGQISLAGKKISAGIYFLKIYSQSSQMVQKIIVSK